MNHQLKEEEDQKTKIDLQVFKPPGIYVNEPCISFKSSNSYKIYKIEKILNRIMSV